MSTDEIFSKIKDLAQNTGQQAARELADMVEDANRLPYLDSLATKYLKYKGMAIASDEAKDVEYWADRANHVELTMEHVLVQEQVAASAEVAAIIKRALMALGTGFCMVAKELVAVLVQGAVKGAVNGLTNVGGASG